MSLSEQFTGRNMGGLLRIHLVEVDTISDDSINNFTADSTTPIYFTDQTAKHSEKQKITQNGELWQAKISFSVPKIQAEIIEYIQKNALKYFVLIVLDANKISRKVGTIDNPLKLNLNLESGANRTDRNQVEFEFEGNLLKPSPIIDYTF
jgi:hypothetical protein